MGFRINTNISALKAINNMSSTNLKLASSLEKLSSGLRINKASDDSSSLAIADSLQMQEMGLSQAILNANDAIGVVQTADGALNEYINIINEIRTKSIQAASDGQNHLSRKAIQNDIDKLLEEAQNIATTTSFNGQTILNGAYENKSFHIGAYQGETVQMNIKDTRINHIGKFASSISSSIDKSDMGHIDMKMRISLSDDSKIQNINQNSTNFTILVSGARFKASNSSYDNAKIIADEVNAKVQTTAGGMLRASVVELTNSTQSKPLWGIRFDSNHAFMVEEFANGRVFNTSQYEATLENNLSNIDVSTRENAELAIITTSYALNEINEIRSQIGSVQNQLESTISNITTTKLNIAAAQSQLRDLDFAKESANFTKLNILTQSGTYALSQANAVQQNVLSLLK